MQALEAYWSHIGHSVQHQTYWDSETFTPWSFLKKIGLVLFSTLNARWSRALTVFFTDFKQSRLPSIGSASSQNNNFLCGKRCSRYFCLFCNASHFSYPKMYLLSFGPPKLFTLVANFLHGCIRGILQLWGESKKLAGNSSGTQTVGLKCRLSMHKTG